MAFDSQAVTVELSDFAIFSVDPATLGNPPSRVDEVFEVVDAGFSGTGTFTTDVDEDDPDPRGADPFLLTGDLNGTDEGGNPFDLSGSLDAHVSIWNVDGQQTLVFLAEGELEGTGAGQTGDVIDGTHDTLAVGHATNDVPIN